MSSLNTLCLDYWLIILSHCGLEVLDQVPLSLENPLLVEGRPNVVVLLFVFSIINLI